MRVFLQHNDTVHAAGASDVDFTTDAAARSRGTSSYQMPVKTFAGL